jgi:hypothetical protein
MCAGTVLLNSRQVFRLALSKLEKCQLSKRATFELTSGGVSTRVSFNHHSTICSMSPPSLALKPSELHKTIVPIHVGQKQVERGTQPQNWWRITNRQIKCANISMEEN